MERYRQWQEKYDVVGDVRGLGGMVGIEFVKDSWTKEPAPELTSAIIHEAVCQGLLVEGAILVDYRDFGSGELAEVVMMQQGRLMANNYVTLTRLDVEKIYASLY